MRNRGILLSMLLASLFMAPQALAGVDAVAIAKKSGENQIRRLLDPVLEKYCMDECKLLAVSVQVDVAKADDIAPGFDDVDPRSTDIVPSSAQARLLIDDRVGPVSRGKLIELLQQYLDTLDYPVKVDTQVVHFPAPIGTESKVAELREKVTKQFRNTLNDLFQQFCPEQCMLADLSVKADAVNGEEAQYGPASEYFLDGDTAIRIRGIGATILMDSSLSAEERTNILQMARLKTNYLRNVELSDKAMKFPHPIPPGSALAEANGVGRGLASEQKSATTTDSKNSTNATSTATTDTKNTQLEKTERSDVAKSNSTSNNSSSTSSNNNSSTSAKKSEVNDRSEHFEKFEKIERVENGDAVQAELKKFQFYGLIFACSILSLLIFIAMASFRIKLGNAIPAVQRAVTTVAADPVTMAPPPPPREIPVETPAGSDRAQLIGKRYEIERLMEELGTVYAQQPKVAKQVFGRILTEEGVEVTAQYIQLFGESIVVDLLRDPSLQSDVSELMEFYAKNPMELSDDEKLDLLHRLHNRTVAGKLVVLGNRSSNLFDWLTEMDGAQILELIRTESLTVKSIVLTQCDPAKRSAIYAQLDEDMRMKLLTELSRIDYLPRDYIFNVANALKRKRRDNPRLNTEALPGSEVLVTLLERTGPEMQRTVIRNLESTNPESARTVKCKLVSIETLHYLRDGQLLEVILSLKHDELLQFLKGTSREIKETVFARAPKELVLELEEELAAVQLPNRETYLAVERKVLNRMKMMANEGLINLVETNERMFAAYSGDPVVGSVDPRNTGGTIEIKRAGGW